MPVLLPRSAGAWRDVQHMVLHEPPRPRAEAFEMRWEMERFQLPREVPIMDNGNIIDWLILPVNIQLEEAQDRIANASPPGQIWTLVTIAATSWVIHRTPVPHSVQRLMARYEDLRRTLEHHHIHPPDSSPDSRALQRGGARKSRLDPNAPRTAMIQWALEKAEEHCPGILPSTLTMLMRAENRTTMAILNSKSASQTQEVVGAAMKRAGIRADILGHPAMATPQSAQPAASGQHPDERHTSFVTKDQMDNIISLLNSQLQVLQQWMATQDEKHTRDQLSTLQVIGGFNQAQTDAMHGLAAAVDRLEGKMQEMEPKESVKKE